MTAAVVHRISLFPLAIPLRQDVLRAASHPGFTGPVVVAVELTTGTIGYGETLPCRHLTGETVDSVLSAVRDTFAPVLMDFHPTSFPVMPDIRLLHVHSASDVGGLWILREGRRWSVRR